MTLRSWFLRQAETRAEFAERSVAKLEKTIDDLEGMDLSSFQIKGQDQLDRGWFEKQFTSCFLVLMHKANATSSFIFICNFLLHENAIAVLSISLK